MADEPTAKLNPYADIAPALGDFTKTSNAARAST